MSFTASADRVADSTVAAGRTTRLALLAALAVACAAGNANGEQAAKAGPAATRANDWPRWRGPTRNGIVAEPSGWAEGRWPPGEALWTANVGLGSTSPVVAAGRLYTMGWRGGSDTVLCLDAAAGKQIWSSSYQCPRHGRHAAGDQNMYAGPTATPEYDQETGYLYTLSVDGHINCWDALREGRRVWSLSLYDEYGMAQRPKVGRSGVRDYGYTTSPLVYRDWLIVEVGARAGNMMAFSKRTGKREWTSESTDFAGHTGGPALMTVEGIPCAVVLTHANLLVVRLDSGNEGKTMAQHPWATHFANSIASPAVYGNHVLITSGYNHKTIVKLKITSRGATRLWEQPYVSQICSPIIYSDHVYWAWRHVHCLDFASGKLVWRGASTGSAGSCILTSDRRLIVWAKNGDLLLAEAADRSPKRYTELARMNGVFRTQVWPHVVLANRRLYCKDRNGNLKCFSLRGGEKPVSRPAPGGEKPIVLKSWPGKAPGLLLAWHKGLGTQLLGPSASTDDTLSLKPRGSAKFDDEGCMELTGGAFLAQGADALLLSACKETNELSVETVLKTHDLSQTGPARIISFSLDPYRRNFTLGQERSRLILRLRTPLTGDNGMKPQTDLCSLRPAQFHHVIVSYRTGQLMCYLDGRSVLDSSSVQGDFSNWAAMHLLFGDEWQGRRDWSGQIERVAIHSRFIGPREAEQRFGLWRTESTQ